MSLYTGKWICSYKWNYFPMDGDTINIFEWLAEYEHQPLLTYGFGIFECATGLPILEDEQQVPEYLEEFV